MTQNIAVERQKTSRWDLFSHNTPGRVVRAARAVRERSARRVRIARRAARAQRAERERSEFREAAREMQPLESNLAIAVRSSRPERSEGRERLPAGAS